jgi:hypothetical protein
MPTASMFSSSSSSSSSSITTTTASKNRHLNHRRRRKLSSAATTSNAHSFSSSSSSSSSSITITATAGNNHHQSASASAAQKNKRSQQRCLIIRKFGPNNPSLGGTEETDASEEKATQSAMEHLFPKRISDEEYDQLDDEIKSLAISSEQTQMVNAEFTIAGFVEISDSGRSNARKVLLQHPSGALCEIYTKGASVASWSMPNGGDVLFTPELSDFSKESPKTCGLAYNFPNWDGFNLFDDMSTDTTTTTTTNNAIINSSSSGDDESNNTNDNNNDYDENNNTNNNNNNSATTSAEAAEKKRNFNMRASNFDILETGIRELWNPEDNTYTANPFVTMYTTDDDNTRKYWDNNQFQITLTFTLEFDALNISHSVTNMNNQTLTTTTTTTAINNNNNNDKEFEDSSTTTTFKQQQQQQQQQKEAAESLNIIINDNNIISGGEERSFQYASGFKGHIRVADLTSMPPRAYYLGLDNCVYFDTTESMVDGDTKISKKAAAAAAKKEPKVKFTKDLDPYDELCFTLNKKTERIYANVKRDSTMLEIGTGSALVIEDYDRFAVGYDYPDETTAELNGGNWHDRAVFTNWKTNKKDETYRWYAGLGFGNITKLVKLKSGETQTHGVRLVIRDSTLSENIIRERDGKRSYEAVEKQFAKREVYAIEGSELPTDFQ